MSGGPIRSNSLPARFWAKVRNAAALDCWEWTAGRDTGGYGQFSIDGRLRKAHRVAWELLRGDIPDGLELDHLCRNRSCVNPWHLEPVTHQVNAVRGLTPILSRARNLAKTHCPKGHPYSGENLYITPIGQRHCRTCRSAQAHEAYLRKKARKVAATS